MTNLKSFFFVLFVLFLAEWGFAQEQSWNGYSSAHKSSPIDPILPDLEFSQIRGSFTSCAVCVRSINGVDIPNDSGDETSMIVPLGNKTIKLIINGSPGTCEFNWQNLCVPAYGCAWSVVIDSGVGISWIQVGNDYLDVNGGPWRIGVPLPEGASCGVTFEMKIEFLDLTQYVVKFACSNCARG